MATATLDLGEDGDPALPDVRVRLDGLDALVVVPGAILSPTDAVAYAQRIFAAAASDCAQARLDVAGRA